MVPRRISNSKAQVFTQRLSEGEVGQRRKMLVEEVIKAVNTADESGFLAVKAVLLGTAIEEAGKSSPRGV
eukprot:11159764-Lingulodinium_polyedra.AAC.1